MKKLRVNLEEIGEYMQDQERHDMDFYLDRERGGIIILQGEVIRRMEDGESTDDLPDWEKGEIETAKEILWSNSSRYIRIPEKPSYEGYDLMEEFANRVEDELLKRKLAIALDGKSAFRRFKDVLLNYPDHREKWFRFKQERINSEVIEWLNSIGIEPGIE